MDKYARLACAHKKGKELLAEAGDVETKEDLRNVIAAFGEAFSLFSELTPRGQVGKAAVPVSTDWPETEDSSGGSETGTDAPSASLYVPLPHSWQVASDVAPSATENLPFWHAAHVLLLAAPCTPE